MIVDLLLLLLGGVLLCSGAVRLVAGTAAVAQRLRVPPLVVALTIVSFASCAPELALSLLAATRGQSALVLGNVIGANVANLGLVLGLVALIAPPRVDPALFKRDVPFLLVASLAAGPVLLNGQIDRYEGVAFFLGAVVFTLSRFRRARAQLDPSEAQTPAPSPEAASQFWRGLGSLTLGGLAFAWSASELTRGLDLSERLIGLSVLALPGAAPEITVALVAALRRHPEIALGNLVGSTLFNVLAVFGLTALCVPIQGRLVEVRPELIAMTLLTFTLAVSVHKARQITRAEGLLYLLGYLAFLGFLATTST